MTELSRISIVCTAETALRKLKNAKITVYNCKKNGAHFIFSIKDKDIEKIFAIFAKPCYNVCIIGKSIHARLYTFVTNRFGLILGALIFVLATILSNAFILRIEVCGNGKYLYPQVKSIIYEYGAGEYRYFKGFNAPAATGKILALPDVTFCNIEKKGAVLLVDVRVEQQAEGSAKSGPLVADADGKVVDIITICGTPAVAAGDSVRSGDTLIYAHSESGSGCLAVGHVQLQCTGSFEYRTAEQSEEALKAAYAKANLYAGEILTRNHTVKEDTGGFVYVIEFTYLHKLSINME